MYQIVATVLNLLINTQVYTNNMMINSVGTDCKLMSFIFHVQKYHKAY